MKTKNFNNFDNSRIINGKIIHSVYLWLNNPENKNDVNQFEKAIKTLVKNTQFATKIHLGNPANTKKRDIIENTYHYCLIFTFDSYEDEKKYQNEDAHKKFISIAKKLWKKVLVFDSFLETI